MGGRRLGARIPCVSSKTPPRPAPHLRSVEASSLPEADGALQSCDPARARLAVAVGVQLQTGEELRKMKPEAGWRRKERGSSEEGAGKEERVWIAEASRVDWIWLKSYQAGGQVLAIRIGTIRPRHSYSGTRCCNRHRARSHSAEEVVFRG